MAKKTEPDVAALTQSWALPPAATLGSSMRVRGLFLELRARLPFPMRPALRVSSRTITLTMPEGSEDAFSSASAIIGRALETIETLPVLPREIEDILTISTAERRRWLEDGRLPSAGTRTVKLRGRARKITFHVFDPAMVEDLLDRGAVDEWREDDALARQDKRRQAAYQAKLTRSLNKAARTARKPAADGDDGAPLKGWEAFGKDGLLR